LTFLILFLGRRLFGCECRSFFFFDGPPSRGRAGGVAGLPLGLFICLSSFPFFVIPPSLFPFSVEGDPLLARGILSMI